MWILHAGIITFPNLFFYITMERLRLEHASVYLNSLNMFECS